MNMLSRGPRMLSGAPVCIYIYIYLICIYLYFYVLLLVLSVCTRGLRVTQFQFSVCVAELTIKLTDFFDFDMIIHTHKEELKWHSLQVD